MIKFTSKYKDGIILHNARNELEAYGFECSHEYIAIKILENKCDEDSINAFYFTQYIFDFYPDYVFTYLGPLHYRDNMLLECQMHSYNLKNYLLYGYDGKKYNKAMLFGDICLDFLIRYFNYTLIDCSKEKWIITACDNCSKKFEKELLDGYKLQKRAKVILMKYGFKKVPCLPTKDTYFDYDEYIETNNTYQRVLKPYNSLKD